MADGKTVLDFEALVKAMNVSLGDGVAGIHATVGGKRFLIAAVNLDHSPLPISEGQMKYANEHPVKNKTTGQMEVKPPTPYIAKGTCILETNHQVSISAKPVKPRSNGGGSLF